MSAPPDAQRSESRLRAFLSRFRELFPWTPLGVVLTAAAYAALEWFAYARLDLVWLVVGYVGLGLTLLSPIVVLLAAAWLRLRGPLPGEGELLTLETGSRLPTGFRLPSLWYLPLVQVRVRWLWPRGVRVEMERHEGVLHEHVTASDRGRHDHVQRLIVVSDPFGISRVSVRLKDRRAADVLPRIGGLRRLPTLSSFASGDAMPHPLGLDEGDRLELSRYAPGDPARFIHWKVLGRTRKLMVRRPERALSVARRMAAFLVAGDDDDASAAAARLSIERELLGSDWTFGTDLSPGGVSDPREALDALIRSREVRPDEAGGGLPAFVQSVQQRGPASFVLFVPPRPGPWLERVAALCRTRKVRAVIGIDGVHDAPPLPFWRRLLSLPERPRGTPAADLDHVVDTLARAGAEVSVFDRGSGRAVSEGHRRGMARLGFAVAGGAS